MERRLGNDQAMMEKPLARKTPKKRLLLLALTTLAANSPVSA